MYKKLRILFKQALLQNKLKRQRQFFDFSALENAKNLIVIIDSILPEYDKDSGSRRLYNIIKLMLKNGYDVVLISNVKAYKYNSAYAEHYQNMGVIVYEPALDQNSKLLDNIRFVKIVAKYAKFAWLHRPDIFSKYHQYFDRNLTRVIFDMVDFHYLRLHREWQISKSQKIKTMAEKALVMELENCSNADCIVAISKSDKTELEHYYKKSHKIKILGNIHQYRNFKGTSMSDRCNLLFVGGFDHKPNKDAVNYLYHDIMPKLWQTHQNLKITIVGSNPTAEILALNDSRFCVLGYVEDLAPFFETARLFVAPLRYGAGVKGKIGQSLEYGLPVVTTTIGAEGFDFSKIEHLTVSDDTTNFIGLVQQLLKDDRLWQEVHQNSEAILEPFSLQTTEQNLLNILQS